MANQLNTLTPVLDVSGDEDESDYLHLTTEIRDRFMIAEEVADTGGE